MSYSKECTPISFAEIVPDSTARVCLINTTKRALSIRDVLMFVHQCSTKRANEKWRNIPEDHKKELKDFISYFQFSGTGNKPEPVIHFEGLLKLIMIVNGHKAALYRCTLASILQRYCDGDLTLTEEIYENKSIGSRKSYEKFFSKVEAEVQVKIAKKSEFQVKIAKNHPRDLGRKLSSVLHTDNESIQKPDILQAGES
jgi:hypothetical protein